MNVLFYSTQVIHTPHIETELELIQQHLDKKDKIYRVICQGHLLSCDMNLQHEYQTCLQCDNNRKCGQKLLEGTVHTLPIITEKFIPDFAIIDNCENIEELKKIKFKNFDVGMAIASSLISKYRDADVNIKDHTEYIKKYYISTIRSYLTAIKHIQKYKPSIVYIFNGRFAYEKAILRATQACNTDFIIHERGGDKEHYNLFVNDTPHNFDYHIKQLEIYWKKDIHTQEEKEKIGSQFFISRKEGNAKDWLSFTDKQIQNSLPDNFDYKKINVGIFNSSLDEYAAIDFERHFPYYANQEDFISNLLKKYENENKYHFYLRVHPNLTNLDNEQIRRINRLSFKNLTVIPADSKVSTYNLLDNCNKIITFGSTIGVEAVYWGKPSILVAKGFYETDVYVAKSYEEVVDFLKEGLLPGNKMTALKYGYYHSVKGIKFKTFKPKNLFRGTYKGINLMEKRRIFTLLAFKLFKRKIIGFPIIMYGNFYKKFKLKLWI